MPDFLNKTTLLAWSVFAISARLVAAALAFSAKLATLPFRRNKPRENRRSKKSVPASLATALDLKMRKSKPLRGIWFVAMLVLVAYLAHPPSHWGPWREYQTGVASYYGPGFWFKRTASGEIFIPLFMTAAHKTLPLGTLVKVENIDTGKCVYVTINDRGPFVKGRIIDLSSFAGWRLGIRKKGTGRVRIYTRGSVSSKRHHHQ